MLGAPIYSHPPMLLVPRILLSGGDLCMAWKETAQKAAVTSFHGDAASGFDKDGGVSVYLPSSEFRDVPATLAARTPLSQAVETLKNFERLPAPTGGPQEVRDSFDDGRFGFAYGTQRPQSLTDDQKRQAQPLLSALDKLVQGKSIAERSLGLTELEKQLKVSSPHRFSTNWSRRVIAQRLTKSSEKKRHANWKQNFLAGAPSLRHSSGELSEEVVLIGASSRPNYVFLSISSCRFMSWVEVPPSTTTTCPVMYEEAGIARNAATEATSSGCPTRLRTERRSISARKRGCFMTPSVSGVSIHPGAIALTRMLLAAHSCASERAA